MRHYMLIFVGLMLVVSSGCSKPIDFDVTFHNYCPGNSLQKNVKYFFSYYAIDKDDPSTSKINSYGNTLDPGQSFTEEVSDGADLNGDRALDSGNLDDTPPVNDVLWLTLDYLDADNDYNFSCLCSANTIMNGGTIVVTIDQDCVPSCEIDQ
jgi:hypothetical protein